MTRQILMFSFSILPNYRWDFCQPEKHADIIAGELHREEGEGTCEGSHGRVSRPALQERVSAPFRKPKGACAGPGGEGGSGSGAVEPPLLQAHLDIRNGGASSHHGDRSGLRKAARWNPHRPTPIGHIYTPPPHRGA